MNNKFDLEAFEKDLQVTLELGRKAFTGAYKDELNSLAGLSKEEIDLITPGVTDLQKYEELITVVKAASKANLDQAALKDQIIKLGDVAVTIAKRVPNLASIL